MLEFNAERHEYRCAGLLVPGVTSLLKSLHSFAGVDPDVLDIARDRGHDVHTMCHHYDDDQLDEEAWSRDFPTVYAYLPSYLRFLADCEPNWRAIEVPVFHKTLRYAGTPDRIGELTYQGKRLADAVIDLKTSIVSHPAWGLQCAAYAQAAGVPNARRFTLQLRTDGAYRLKEWADASDWPAFVSLVTLNTWKLRNKL